MKKISFKRKVKGFATLGGLATVSSLVLAACADNSSTTTETKPAAPEKETVSKDLLDKTTDFLTQQSAGLSVLVGLEQKHFSDLVERLNFEKGLNQTTLNASKTKLGTSSSQALSYESTDDTNDKKIVKINASDVFGILKKMKSDLSTASKVVGDQNKVTPDEFASFEKTVTTFEKAAEDLVAKFSTLPATDDATTDLGTKATALTTALNASTFDATVLKTKMDDFVTEVKTQRTSSTTLVTAALTLTKATAELENFVNTQIAKYVSANPDFSLELNSVISIVTKDVLGEPGVDLFSSPLEAPIELAAKPTSTLVYGVFAKLFRVNESLTELSSSYQRLIFLQDLMSKQSGAVELLAKNFDSLLFNVDFARLNSFLSFNNTNLLSVYDNGPTGTSGTAPVSLVKMAATFQGLEAGFEYISGTGTTDLKQVVADLKTKDTNGSSRHDKYDGVTNKITSDLQKFTDAITKLKEVNKAFTDLNANIQALNTIIRSSEGFVGIMQLLAKVDEIKINIKAINDLFQPTGSETESDIIKKIKAAKDDLALSGDTLGAKLKDLYDAVKTEDSAVKDPVEKIVKTSTAGDTYEDSTIKNIEDFAKLPETFEAALKVSADSDSSNSYSLS